MKKLTAMLLMIGIVAIGIPALAQGAFDHQTVVVASSTPMSGQFYSDMWGNNNVDANIRALIHGYDTSAWDINGDYSVDSTVVNSVTATEDVQGNRTVTFTLNKNLRFNDGTAITAENYVFSILLQSDPAILALGGNNTDYDYLVGQPDYASGNSHVFSSVRLRGERQFSITIAQNALPYYYEPTMLCVPPSPIHVLAPGYTVRDDGDGVYLALPDATVKGTYQPTPLTKTLLEQTLTAENGYLHNPKVTCGPYQLVAYNAQNKTATLEINPEYQGNYEGRTPVLKRIQIVPMANAEAYQAYQAGSVQIIHKVSDAAVVAEARKAQSEGKADVSNYLHSGYSFLAFACEQTPTDDVQVRQALAMCMDRNAFCADLFRGNALPVYGYYGFGQWMAIQNTQELAKYEIPYDIQAAQALLVDAGYTYNEDGKTYREGQKQTRCKIDQGVLIPLELRWAKAPSKASDFALKQLSAACDTLGIRLQVTEMDFNEMLSQYYRTSGKRDYNLFFLSENFFSEFDPYRAYSVEDLWQGTVNTSGLRDAKLMKAAYALRRVKSGDTVAYVDKWFKFQDRWRQMMPTAPVFCNVYFDVCNPAISGYSDYSQYGLACALLYATDQVVQPSASPTPTMGSSLDNTQ